MESRSAKRILTVVGALGIAAAAVLLSTGAGSAQGGITGIWQQCTGGGYLVLLSSGEQVNVVGSAVEVGSYTSDGAGINISTQLLYPAQGSVQRVSPGSETVARYNLQPGTGQLVGQGGGPGQCYQKLPGQ